MGVFWQNLMNGIIEYGFSAYDPLGVWKWPLLFLGIFGFIYGATHSIITTIVGIIGTLAIYGTTTSIFAEVPDVSLFLYAITIVGLAILFTTLFLEWKKG